MPVHPPSSDKNSTQVSRTLLVVAHPGHELRVHNWLETARPQVWVLTDGSGRSGRSRIDSTNRVLEAAGAVPGPVYGAFTDVDLYDNVLNFDHRVFTDVVECLANVIIQNRIEVIAGDAEEGYNPAHDVCRLIINAAIKLAQTRSGTAIHNYDFTLMGAPGRCSEQLSAESLWINLDDAALERKLSAAGSYPELRAEFEAAVSGVDHETFRNDPNLAQRVRTVFGVTEVNDFRTECLRPVSFHCSAETPDHVPFYELYGERQVQAGHYQHVLRYREHVLPLAATLDAHVKRNS
jgi:hypothetical protein